MQSIAKEHFMGVSAKDIARKAGVSVSTVSRALSGSPLINQETRKKIEQIAQSLDYSPNILAKGLKMGKTRTIGIIVPNVSELIFPPIIAGISETANHHQYNVILCVTDENETREADFIANLRQRWVDGLIISTAVSETLSLARLRKDGFPVVLMLRQLDAYNAIIADNTHGGYLGTRTLIDRGFRRIALINGDTRLRLYRERHAGYCCALEEAGIPYDPCLVLQDVFGWQSACEATDRLIESGASFDAVLATSEHKSMGVLRSLQNHGICVPEDVSLMGYDGMDTSLLANPPITSIAQPFFEIGQNAARRLIDLIEENAGPEPITQTMPVTLVERRSVRTKTSSEGGQTHG
jgi:DNA-binding LacI/PurR family transcriptional regulator